LIYAVLAVICASIEMLLIGHATTFMSVITFLPLFYFFSTLIFSAQINPFSQTNNAIINQHKKKLSLYVCAGAAGNFLWFYSAFLMGISNVVVVAVLQRFFILFYSITVLKEKMTPLQIFISTTVILCTFGFASDSDMTEKTGLFICALSFGFYAIADITQKKLSTDVNWKIALILRQGFQMIIFSIAALIYFNGVTAYTNSLSQDIILWTALIAFIGGYLSKSFHFVAVKNMGLSRIMIIEQSKPVLVLFGAFFILHEQITQLQFICSLIILSLTIVFFSHTQEKASK
jgi:drug/metabolite transporter (DMT)-like permease